MPSKSEKIIFTGSLGDDLAARLDLPAGRPGAFALFAHCFTCSKDLFAAARIAGELTQHGFAVLRFDFTGLGASGGDFANTNFSSNVGDLLAAAAYLKDNHEAPKLLIGHSLGGAAVLAAAGELPEVGAVATIGAPADAAHVIHNFGAKAEEIEARGVAEVRLAGRSFTIRKQFLDDLRQQSVIERIRAMKKALLIFHSPRDQIVGIDNAATLFQAAKHPKSFISLDDADHLLSRREDAAYVASSLAAWAERYIDGRDQRFILPTPGPEGVAAVAETGAGKFQQEVVAGNHRLLADEPADFGGLDSGPSPYDFLNIALGACTSMTLRLYADHKKLPLEGVKVRVSHKKIHAEDCVECSEGREGRIDVFEREIEIEGPLDAATRARLIEIADRCPVHRTLEAGSEILTRLREQ